MQDSFVMVVVAVVASSLRRLLQQRKALPSTPLVAIVPVAQSGDEWKKRSGNRLSFEFVSMATEVEIPRDRLARIAVSGQSARKAARLRGVDLWERYSGAVLPGPFHFSVRLAERLKLVERLRPMASIIVSNITGPRHEMTLAGAKLTGLWPFGPPKDGGAINVTMVSYGDHLHVGIQGDKALDAEVHELAEGLAEGLNELTGSAS